jgi:serine protease Do
VRTILPALAVLFFSSLPLRAEENQVILPKEVFKKIRGALYEVVIPRLEDEFVTYDRPLPFDKLPYRQRTDKFRGIGTAFAIGPNRFVSAAHVINILGHSPETEFFLRDQDGKVFAVGKFHRFSTYRDAVEFELSESPAPHPVLALNPKIEIGDTVYVVGNAQGEGISFRAGQVSSFTPEEVDRKWNFIRFSAPASPGNSGGPLLNAAGEVAGIVERKNASENLNYGLPIQEEQKLALNEAEILMQDLFFSRENTKFRERWQANAPLPASRRALAEGAWKSLRSVSDRLIEQAFAPGNKDFFPGQCGFSRLSFQPAGGHRLWLPGAWA